MRSLPPPSSACWRSLRSASIFDCVVGRPSFTRSYNTARRLTTLDRHRHRAAAAQAERGQAEPAAARAKRVDQSDEHARAGGADRVAERDRAAVDVEPIPVEAELAVVGDDLGG